MSADLQAVATTLVANGKGILAADETVPTITRRFEALGIPSTEQSRRTYREMLFTAPGAADYLSGAILQDETIHQQSSSGASMARALAERGVTPGIKVDAGTRPLAGAPSESITEGLDGLRDRLAAYRGLGARFAKWRAVFRISETTPSAMCVTANAHALARYAALCQEQDLVPIVEPEVLMDGAHSLERCEAVTGHVLRTVFDALADQRVALEAMLLKPNMVVPGEDSEQKATVEDVAHATLRCLRRHVPAATPGIVFLSGGQEAHLATAHLNAINREPGPRPWAISFSYGRALQDPALEAWGGRDQNLVAGALALTQRARCNGAASLGTYTDDFESSLLSRAYAPRRGADGNDD